MYPAPLLSTFTTRRERTLTAGMQLCWEVAFPESFRSLLQPAVQTFVGEPSGQVQPKVGPNVIFAPTCWYATDGGPLGMRWTPFGEANSLDSLAFVGPWSARASWR